MGAKKLQQHAVGVCSFFSLVTNASLESCRSLELPCHRATYHLVTMNGWKTGSGSLSHGSFLAICRSHAVHVWNLGHSADALKTNETLCSGGQVKVQSGQITTVWATSFLPWNRIAFRFLFRELGRNLTWCAVWKNGKISAGRKEPSSSFQYFLCDSGQETSSKGFGCDRWVDSVASLIEPFPRKLKDGTFDLKTSWPRTSLLQKELFWILKHFDETFLLRIKK